MDLCHQVWWTTSTISIQLHVFCPAVTANTSERPLLVNRVILQQCSRLFDRACKNLKGFFILKKLHKCTKVLFCISWRFFFFCLLTQSVLFLAWIAMPGIRNMEHALVKLHSWRHATHCLYISASNPYTIYALSLLLFTCRLVFIFLPLPAIDWRIYWREQRIGFNYFWYVCNYIPAWATFLGQYIL